MRKIILLSILFFVSISCKKDEPAPAPKAEFIYLVGNDGIVHFTNKSINAASYEWDFGDFQQSNENDPVHDFDYNGVFQVSLTTKGPGGNDVIVKSINVTTNKGEIVIYKAFNSRNNDILVNIDGINWGYIRGNSFYTKKPDCNDSQSVYKTNMTLGEHKIYALEKNTNYYWETTVNLKGGCQGLALE